MSSLYRDGASTYCHTCKKRMHPMGIARHRAMHRERREDCTITFTGGKTYTYEYSKIPVRS